MFGINCTELPYQPPTPTLSPSLEMEITKTGKNVLINKLNVCENWKDFPCSELSSGDPELLLASSCLFVVVVPVCSCCCCCWSIHLGALICRPRSFCMQMIYAKKCLAARQNWIRLCQPRVESSHSLLLYSHFIFPPPAHCKWAANFEVAYDSRVRDWGGGSGYKEVLREAF